LDRAQRLEKQLQPRLQVQAAIFAVGRDWLAFDIFEREIRLARRRDPGVVQPRNLRMREPRQKVALASEAFGQRVVVQQDNRELEGDLPLEQTVDWLGQPDEAHAAAA